MVIKSGIISKREPVFYVQEVSYRQYIWRKELAKEKTTKDKDHVS